MTLDGVKVASYRSGRVKLAWPQGEVEYTLETLPAEVRSGLLGGALAGAVPRDHLEVGKVFLRMGDTDRAAQCFAQAAQGDPSLKPFCPDVDRIRRMSHIFEGSFRIAGSSLSIHWNFRKPEESKDFEPEKDSRCRVEPQAGLLVSGGKVAVVSIKEIPFREHVRVVASPRDSDAGAHVLGVKFRRPDGAEILIYSAMVTKVKGFLVFRSDGTNTTSLLEPQAYRAGSGMEMDFDRGRFSFRVGGQTMWTGQEGGFTDVEVILGGAALNRADAVAVAFREAHVSGTVNPAWLLKKTADAREALAYELSREHRVNRADPNAEASLALTLDPLLQSDGEAKADYEQALAAMRPFLKSGQEKDYLAAAAALEALTRKRPGLAAAWYWRGVIEEEGDNAGDAARLYEQSLARIEDFPEAICARARLHVMAGDEKAAAELVKHALRLKPDLGEAHLLSGRVDFGAGRAAAALESAALAKKLSPLDADVQARAQMLGNTVRGPSWPRPSRHETAHYAIRSDLPPAKCRAYGEHLEALRAVYQDVLKRPAAEGKRAEVLVFNAPEGYYGFMDVTIGFRGEHTRGVFSPWSGQLALFEDAEGEDTLAVLGHEGFHQYAHAILAGAPVWFDEGMAEYVGASRLRGKAVEVGGIQEGRLENLKAAIKYGWKPVEFDRIMVEPKAIFYGEQAPFKYAQAWSMIHFFRHGDQGRWRELLGAYIGRLAAGDSAREAFESTFGREDLQAMQSSWLRYVGALGGKK
jgi:tetratricopeptide (TPR) repeat protein